MAKLYIVAVLEYDEDIMYNKLDPEEVGWWEEEILGGKLHLYSEEIGDHIGEVRIVGLREETVIDSETEQEEG